MFQTEKLLKEQADKVSAEDRTKIEAALGELKTALAGEDVDVVRQKHEALLTASQEFAQRLYQAAQAQQAAPGGEGPASGASQPSDDEVADAEIVDEGHEGHEKSA